MTKNYYEILGLTRDASNQEVTEAIEELKKQTESKNSPDFVELERIMLQPKARQAYNNEISSRAYMETFYSKLATPYIPNNNKEHQEQLSKEAKNRLFLLGARIVCLFLFVFASILLFRADNNTFITQTPSENTNLDNQVANSTSTKGNEDKNIQPNNFNHKTPKINNHQNLQAPPYSNKTEQNEHKNKQSKGEKPINTQTRDQIF